MRKIDYQKAFEASKQRPVPPELDSFCKADEPLARLANLCRELGERYGEFPLSGKVAGGLVGVDDSLRIWRLLRGMEAMELIELTERGGKGKPHSYRYVGKPGGGCGAIPEVPIDHQQVAEIARRMGCPPEISGCQHPEVIATMNACEVLDAIEPFGFHIDPEIAAAIGVPYAWFCRVASSRIVQVGQRDGRPVYRYTGERRWPLPLSPVPA